VRKPFSAKGEQENEKTGKLQKKCINKEMAKINHMCVFFLFSENLRIFLFLYKKKKKTGIFET
jgi:hypothetical protein